MNTATRILLHDTATGYCYKNTTTKILLKEYWYNDTATGYWYKDSKKDCYWMDNERLYNLEKLVKLIIKSLFI